VISRGRLQRDLRDCRPALATVGASLVIHTSTLDPPSLKLVRALAAGGVNEFIDTPTYFSRDAMR